MLNRPPYDDLSPEDPADDTTGDDSPQDAVQSNAAGSIKNTPTHKPMAGKKKVLKL